jgi:hypothetical protein
MLGYAAIMPDVAFDPVGIEADRAQVYDLRDAERPFAAWVRRLVTFTRSVQPRMRNGLNADEIGALVEHLRGDFDLVPSFAIRAGDVNDGLARLTRSQHECLAAAAERPRVLVEGAAGTGKSLLAVELARREARLGRRVLLLCYNVFLASRLRAEIGEPAIDDLVTVRHLHAYARDLITKAGSAGEFEDACRRTSSEEEVYGVVYPYFAELALARGGGTPFDVLILDEAQDVLNDGVLSLLAASLDGGLDAGRWRIFLDSNDQAAMYKKLDERALARVRHLAPTYSLGVNCRNTKEIEIATRAVARPRTPAPAWQTGEPVERRWYVTADMLVREMRGVLRELEKEGVRGSRVTVLFPRTPSDGARRAMAECGVQELNAGDAARLGRDDDAGPFWATASAFKGLENDVVVVVGVENVETDWWRAVTYVAMSRARVRLYVLLHESLRAVVDARFAELLRTILEEARSG